MWYNQISLLWVLYILGMDFGSCTGVFDETLTELISDRYVRLDVFNFSITFRVFRQHLATQATGALSKIL